MTKPKPELTVWERIFRAYRRKTGLRLSGGDVDTLYLGKKAKRVRAKLLMRPAR